MSFSYRKAEARGLANAAVPTILGFVLMLALGMSQTRSIHWHTLVPGLLPPGSNVLDLGANVGLFSLEMVRLFDCCCHAVEPDPELLAAIPDNPRIRKHGYAIADRRAPLVLNRSSNRLGARILDSPTGGSVENSLMVEGIDLTSFIDRHVEGPISLIKMDIEGAELQVLDSLSDDLLRSVAQFSVEFHDFCGLTSADEVARVARRLEALGFFYVRMSGVGHQDTLFVNRRQSKFKTSDHLATRLFVRNVRGLRRVVRRGLGLAIRC
jgi:FkbM family methyltransferase